MFLFYLYTLITKNLTKTSPFWGRFIQSFVKEVLLLSKVNYVSSSKAQVSKFADLSWHSQQE